MIMAELAAHSERTLDYRPPGGASIGSRILATLTSPPRRPFASEALRIWSISTRVNKPENDDASILDEVPAQAMEGI
jgi:hypothetical protein